MSDNADPRDDDPEIAEIARIERLCEALVAIDLQQLASLSVKPSTSDVDVVPGHEPDAWMDIPSVLSARHANIPSWACFRAAELRMNGKSDARVIARRHTFAHGSGENRRIYTVAVEHEPGGVVEEVPRS